MPPPAGEAQRGAVIRPALHTPGVKDRFSANYWSVARNWFLWQFPQNQHMKYKLPCLPDALRPLAMLSLPAVAAGLLAMQNRGSADASQQSPERPFSEQDAEPGPVAQRGNQLLARSIAALRNLERWTARLRYRGQALGQSFVGLGECQYRRDAEGPKFRLQVNVQAGDSKASLLRVVDGQHIWTDQYVHGRREVGRVRLSAVRSAWQSRSPGPAHFLPAGTWEELPASLAANYDFRQTGKAELGGVPVIILTGKLIAGPLTQKFSPGDPGRLPSTGELPAHVPNEVEVMLGSADGFLYAVNYARRNEDGQVRTLLELQLYAVQFGTAGDRRQFVYTPGDATVADHTGRYINHLKHRWEKETNR